MKSKFALITMVALAAASASAESIPLEDMPRYFRVDQLLPGWRGEMVFDDTLCVTDGELRVLANSVVRRLANVSPDSFGDSVQIIRDDTGNSLMLRGADDYKVEETVIRTLARDCAEQDSVGIVAVYAPDGKRHQSFADFLKDF